MLLESIIATQLMRGSVEKFNEEKKESGNGVIAWMFLISVIVYLIAALVLLVRVIMKAFACSVSDGAAALFVPSLYAMWVYGGTIPMVCGN